MKRVNRGLVVVYSFVLMVGMGRLCVCTVSVVCLSSQGRYVEGGGICLFYVMVLVLVFMNGIC